MRGPTTRRPPSLCGRTVEAMNSAIGLACGVIVAVAVLTLAYLTSSGRLDRMPDRRACVALGAFAVVIVVGAVGLWATLPLGWRLI